MVSFRTQLLRGYLSSASERETSGEPLRGSLGGKLKRASSSSVARAVSFISRRLQRDKEASRRAGPQPGASETLWTMWNLFRRKGESLSCRHSGRDAADNTVGGAAVSSDLAPRRRASTEARRCGFYIPKSIIPVLKSLFMGDVKITHFSQLAQTSRS